MIGYDEIQKILCSENFCKLIPDGLILSEPILGINDELKTVNFFVASKHNDIYNPLYKFSICLDSKELISFSEYISPNLKECEKQIGMNLEEYENYKELFLSVENMYYGIQDVNSDIICDYIANLYKLIPSSLIPYYNELSIGFFEWVKEKIM